MLVSGLWLLAAGCSGGASVGTGNCTTNDDCGAGQTCSGGYCRGCQTDAECPSGQTCVRSASRSACVPAPAAAAPCDAPADYCAAAREALGTAPIACVANYELDCTSSAPACRMCYSSCGPTGCVGEDAGGGDAGGGGDDGGGADGGASMDAGGGGDDGGSPGDDSGPGADTGAGDSGSTGGDSGTDAGTRDAGPSTTCGNGVVEDGEGCDPPAPGGCGLPACNDACLLVPAAPACGNGCAEGEEECGEPGLPGCADGFLCLACTCQAPRCGDGVAQTGERCGEPGLVCGAGKTCVDCQCTPAICGDGAIDLGEACGEPGLPGCPMGQSCTTACRCEAPSASCGNGTANPGEECGEPGLRLCGPGRECVGCVCRNECGNGEVNAGEECGEAGISCPSGSSCNIGTCRCSLNCGNGALDSGETCDPPGTPSCASANYCNASCQLVARPVVPELCNGLDDNCNGMIDEGLRDICFECDSSCSVGPAPPPGGWTPGPTNSSGVIVDMDGALTLGRRMAESYAVWIANMDEGTVSKLDSRTGQEIALYPTVSNMAPAGTRPWNEACNWSNLGNCPSRTAVDQNFDAYVANRAFGRQGSVTKYANAERDCVDRNMNGVIDTSRDLNGNGVIDRGTAEFVGLADECILWNVAVGANNAVPRALAVGVAVDTNIVGDVWVGLFNTGQACRLNPTNGALIGCVGLTRPGTSTFTPYGAAAYRDGRIYFVKLGWGSDRPRDMLAYVNPTTMTTGWASDVPTSVGGGSYGMGVDGNGHVWVAGAHSAQLKRYDIATDTWIGFTPARAGCPAASLVRGVAADATYIWATDFDRNLVWQVRISDNATMNCWPFPAGITGAIGSGVSFDGSVWAISQPQNAAVRIAVTDPVAGTGVTTSHPVGLHPYTYSDFIGFGLNTFAEPRGYYRYVLTGCGTSAATRWQGIRFTGETPAGTSVTFFARSSQTMAGLATEAWIGPFTGNPANLQAAPGPVPEGNFLEVEVRLSTTDRGVVPRVFTVDVAHTCIEPG